jgi:hypothetical protein
MDKNKNLKIYYTYGHYLEYEEWSEMFADEIDMELINIGANNELDFNPEREYEKRYQIYLEVYYNSRV